VGAAGTTGPGNGDCLAGAGLARNDQTHTVIKRSVSADNFQHTAGNRTRALLKNISDFVEAGLGRRVEVTRKIVPDTDIVLIASLIGASRNDGDIVLGMNGQRPADAQWCLCTN